MSQDRDLNPGPFPYHGNALPTELSWRFVGGEGLEPPKSRGLVVYSHMQLPLCEPPFKYCFYLNILPSNL